MSPPSVISHGDLLNIIISLLESRDQNKNVYQGSNELDWFQLKLTKRPVMQQNSKTHTTQIGIFPIIKTNK